MTGDPLNDAVIVWTRFTPTSVDDTVDLELRMAKVDPSIEVNDHLDPSKNEHLHRAKVTVTSETDFIAKIDVTGLEAGANYVFAFSGQCLFLFSLRTSIHNTHYFSLRYVYRRNQDISDWEHKGRSWPAR